MAGDGLDRVRILLMFLCMIALCLVITGAVTNSWSYGEEGKNADGTSGLWKICPDGVCRFMDWEKIPAWLFAVQALFIVGKLLTVLAFIGSIILVMRPQIRIWYLSIASLLPAILLFIGLGLYNTSSARLEYSFYLVILGSLMLLVVFITSTMNHYQVVKANKKRHSSREVIVRPNAWNKRPIATSRDLIREDFSSISGL